MFQVISAINLAKQIHNSVSHKSTSADLTEQEARTIANRHNAKMMCLEITFQVSTK